MPTHNSNNIVNYKTKCYFVENERLFGDTTVTCQTSKRQCMVDNWQGLTVYAQGKRNLMYSKIETPNFMELNRTMTANGNKRRKAFSSISTSTSTDSRVYFDNGNKYHRQNDIMEDLVKKQKIYPMPVVRESHGEVMISSLVDQLLSDIYRYPRSDRERSESDSTVSSFRPRLRHRYLQKTRLYLKSNSELSILLETLQTHVNHAGGLLIRQLRRRDYLRTKRDRQYDVITAHLQARSNKKSEDTRMRFSLTPQPGESGFAQWLDAMKMVARLPGGIPQEFRKRLWLTLAERHLEQRGVDWKQAEKLCFNEWTNPDDEELGIQIVKDLHRTGCSLFCGAAGRDNQAVLRRVLLGFARWNKSVGYCQGLNVLAALVLQVTDRAEASAVKVMIYLIEGVLPEGYFADNLRGLSIDMAVFRDLLRMRLPKLSRHLEALQCDARDKATVGSSYEPPLTNVFTMQWFLTLFCHCLPQDTVLRVWDLIFLEGDEVLLRTALAIWEGISDRVMSVSSADEFYSIMGVLTREMLEFTDTNNLIKMVVSMGSLHGVTDLREKHRYNITPWARRLSDDDDDTDIEDDENLGDNDGIIGKSPRAKKDRRSIVSGTVQTFSQTGDREKLALDISTLKQQYSKLRERQRQAHIILSGKSRAACARQTIVPPSASQAMNHLLVGKNALVSSKTRQLGPPPGIIPSKTRITSINNSRNQIRRDKQGVTLHWKDTKKSRETKNEPAVTDELEFERIESLEGISINVKSTTSLSSSPRRGSANSDSDSTSTELCDEPDRFSDSEDLTSSSDYYVTATDDEKVSHQNSSLIADNSLTHSPRDTDNVLNVKHICGVSENDETSISIAKITDQIRRLSAEEDNNSFEIVNLPILRNNEDSDDVITMSVSKTIVEGNFLHENEDKRESSIMSVSDEMNILNRDNDANTNESKVSELNKQFVTSNEKILFSPNEQCIRLPSRDEIDVKTDSKILETNTTRKDNIELIYSSSRSLDITKNNERDIPTKVPISARSNTVDSSVTYSYTLQKDMSQVNTVESTYYKNSYVIGHVPISPITIDNKFCKSSDTELSCDSTAFSTEIDNSYSKTQLTTYNITAPVLSINYDSLNLINTCQEKNMISPKSPESTVSVSSGETMGPDSKVSSITTSPRTPLTSDLCKFVADKSVCSSTSSESKTLTLLSMDSTDIGQSRSKVDYHSDITRPSFDKSSSSTPISTDSLRNKSELISPSKLIASSSGDSYNNSPSKAKYTERSFSSGLQSPISANSIKYTTNYRGQNDLSESPVDVSSATSPFYPIANPNQKSPSPNRTIPKPKNVVEYDDGTPNKISLSEDSTNTILYSFQELPKVFKVSSVETNSTIKNNDEYDSARSFETELAETLSVTRLKNEKDLSVDLDKKKLPNESHKKIFESDICEGSFESEDTVSPLPCGKYDTRSKTHINISESEKKNDDDNSLLVTRESMKLYERSCSSLEKRFSEIQLSTSSEDFITSKKRSSDILADLRHLEANSIETSTTVQTADTIMTRKTGYGWEDLKNLEARRQDNFSDSASEFSKYRLDIPSISVSADGRKSYVVEPKIQIDINSDSILKNYTQKKDNGEPDDDDGNSKLGVWTKVKPRKIGENGRRSSSDRALKIIQENSAILHKILTCQAKKCLPDLEEISKEITISPINEEISKIFSPILEKMGLNEHEINEELARINLKDIDEMTIASGSEFDAKINDELSKLSLIDDHEEITHLDVDEMIGSDYLKTREALIDKQINEELSKLLENYERESPVTIHQSLHDKVSLSQKSSEIESLDISTVSTNAFSYPSPSDLIETKSDIGAIQNPVSIQSENFLQYSESCTSGHKYTSQSNPIKYEVPNLSPRSDTDIYRELEKLDKISSARVFPSFSDSSTTPKTLISPNDYTTASPTLFPQVQQSTIEYSTEPKQSFDTSPLKSPHYPIYKPYDFQVSKISPLKSSPNHFFSRSYETSTLNDDIEFSEHNTNKSRNTDIESKRKILTKDNLEFRVRYDEEIFPNQHINNDSFSIERYQTNLPDLDHGASYYTDESPITLKRLSIDNDRELINSTVSPLNYSYDRASGMYTKKFSSTSPMTENYVYTKQPTANDYDAQKYQLTDDPVGSSYIGTLRHRDDHSHSPNYQFIGREFSASSVSNYTCSKLSPSLEATGPSESVSDIGSEFVDEPAVSKFSEVPISRDSIAYRKSSMTLGPLDAVNRISCGKFHETPSPKSQFNPFPVRTITRRPKELGLKLGLYSPSSPGSISQSKRS